MKILIQHGAQRLGPYTDDEARAALASGAVHPGDLAWREGSAAWVPLAGLLAQPAGLAGSAPSPSATPQIPGLAVASLVLGIASFTCLMGIPAIITGHMARAKIRNSQGKLTGSGVALAGLILGYAGTLLVGLSILSGLLIPAFSAARGKGDEAARANVGRQIYVSCTAYKADHQGHWPPALADLVPKYIQAADAGKWFSDPAQPDSGKNPWIYYGGSPRGPVSNPATSILLVNRNIWGGRNVAVHFDGSVTMELNRPEW